MTVHQVTQNKEALILSMTTVLPNSHHMDLMGFSVALLIQPQTIKVARSTAYERLGNLFLENFCLINEH